MSKYAAKRPMIAALTLALSLAVVPAAAQVEDHREIEFPQLGEFEIPRPEIIELDNGLKIFLLEDHELPLIRLQARIRTGSLWEPAEKTGLARITGAVQRTGGTRSMTGDEIDDFLEARAASVETSAGGTVGFAAMDCLVGDFDEVLGVFNEVLRHPVFAEDKLEIAKVQANTAIARRNDNVNAIAAREFSRLVYGLDSPLSRLEEYATVAAIERQDLIDWHRRFHHPNNIYLGVVGDFDSAAMAEKLRATFGDWPRGPEFEMAEVDYLADQEAGVYYIEKTDVNQAFVRLGHLGIRVENPDFFAVQVLNEVVGGGFASRLFRRIRSEMGLAYSVGGGVRASFIYPGVAAFGLSTKSETMGEAVDALYRELSGETREPVSEEELQRAKDSILNSFIFNYASMDQILGQQMLYSYYGLPLDFLETYRSNVERVTRKDVDRVAAEYLHPERASLLVVGRKGDFDRPLSSFGEVTELDITIPSPPAPELEVARSAETLAAGGEILASMVAAMGGEGAESAKAVRVLDRIEVTMGAQSMTLQQSVLLVFPDRMRVSVQLPAGEQVVVVDGGEGFASVGGETRPLEAEEVERRLSDLGRNLDYLARYGRSEGPEAVAIGEEEVEGVPCRVVAVSFRGADSRLCVDSEGRVLRQSFRGPHPIFGAPVEFEIDFSDYRSVEGRQVPFRRVTRLDGTPFSSAVRESFKLDPEVDPALFERPAA